MTWTDAAITVRAGTDHLTMGDYGETWRVSLCAPGLFDPTGKHADCPLPVARILARRGFSTRGVPAEIVAWCTDPCTEMLWSGVVGWLNSGDKGRAAKLRAIREVRAERQAAARIRI